MSGLQIVLIAAVCVTVLVLGIAARYGVSRRAVIAEIERELDGGDRDERGEERAA
jgi:hypothetical protein